MQEPHISLPLEPDGDRLHRVPLKYLRPLMSSMSRKSSGMADQPPPSSSRAELDSIQVDDSIVKMFI